MPPKAVAYFAFMVKPTLIISDNCITKDYYFKTCHAYWIGFQLNYLSNYLGNRMRAHFLKTVNLVSSPLRLINDRIAFKVRLKRFYTEARSIYWSRAGQVTGRDSHHWGHLWFLEFARPVESIRMNGRARVMKSTVSYDRRKSCMGTALKQPCACIFSRTYAKSLSKSCLSKERGKESVK